MRKRILTLVVLALGVLVCTQLAVAGPMPAVNDLVKLSGGNGVTSGPGRYGGAFDMTEQSSPSKYTIPVFCIEFMESFSKSGTYKINNISQTILNGGAGSSGVSLSFQVDYLFMLWSTNQLGGLLGYTGSGADQAALQAAFWYLQYGSASLTSNWGANNAYAEYAALHASNQDYGTRVLNLVDNSNGALAQSQLYRPPTSVPEPSSLILLGLGLLGVGSATFRRKR